MCACERKRACGGNDDRSEEERGGIGERGRRRRRRRRERNSRPVGPGEDVVEAPRPDLRFVLLAHVVVTRWQS